MIKYIINGLSDGSLLAIIFGIGFIGVIILIKIWDKPIRGI